MRIGVISIEVHFVMRMVDNTVRNKMDNFKYRSMNSPYYIKAK